MPYDSACRKCGSNIPFEMTVNQKTGETVFTTPEVKCGKCKKTWKLHVMANERGSTVGATEVSD